MIVHERLARHPANHKILARDRPGDRGDARGLGAGNRGVLGSEAAVLRTEQYVSEFEPA